MRFQYYEIRPCVDFGDDVVSFLGEEEYDPCLGHHHTWQGALKEAEAAADGLPIFWTLYGVNGTSTAIGDFVSFEYALKILQAILIPFREGDQSAIEDICNQSSSEERL